MQDNNKQLYRIKIYYDLTACKRQDDGITKKFIHILTYTHLIQNLTHLILITILIIQYQEIQLI